ncbi:MAG: hypothetical protein AAF732_16800 [Pseudomonadota bacterium]
MLSALLDTFERTQALYCAGLGLLRAHSRNLLARATQPDNQAVCAGYRPVTVPAPMDVAGQLAKLSDILETGRATLERLEAAEAQAYAHLDAATYRLGRLHKRITGLEVAEAPSANSLRADPSPLSAWTPESQLAA